MNDRTKDDAPSAAPAQKKPYQAPVLIQWGTLRDITQTSGKTSKSSDGGGAKVANRTS